MATQVELSPDQRADLVRGAQQVATFMLGAAARQVASRYAFWGSVRGSLQAIGFEGEARATFPALWAANAKADANARAYAQLVSGLRSGRYQLAAWTTDRAQRPTFGVIRAGAGELGLPFVPVLWLLGSAALAGGAWVVANAFGTAQKTSAEAELLRAETAQQITAATTALSLRDPQAAAQLAAALGEANKAALAASPGLLDRLVSGAQRAASSAAGALGAGGGGALLAIGVIYLLSRRGRA